LSQVIAKARRRQFYPVKIHEEFTAHFRAPNNSDRESLNDFNHDVESFGYLIGVCWLNEDGSTVFTHDPQESPKEFGARVLKEADLPEDTRSRMITAILKLAADPPDLDATIKN
jgi:hypothetical protein